MNTYNGLVDYEIEWETQIPEVPREMIALGLDVGKGSGKRKRFIQSLRDLQLLTKDRLKYHDLSHYLQIELIHEIEIHIKDKGLTHKEVAKRAGVSEEDVSDLLHGCIRTFDIISKVLKGLDLNVDVVVKQNVK